MENLDSQGAIIPAHTAIDTFRESGYKNTASAIAELIDNSIEAEADHIQILTFEEQVCTGKRNHYQIQEIAVYDDGLGMSEDVLKICLQFGNGTRLNTRTGIGRFGIGLPNASVSQAKRVDVYSWQNDQCYHTYLDVDEIKDQNQNFVNIVDKCELPAKYREAITVDFKSHGSLIVWSKCDKLDLKRSRTLYNSMSQDLCRIYRHFLDDDETYGRKIDMKLVTAGSNAVEMELKPNDPLYLMTPNNVPGKETEATNILHDEIITLSVTYDEEGNVAPVEVRFSLALPETQEIGGASPLGKHYGKNIGISFMRACREIDFGCFGYFNIQDTRERWWGCEIRFEPVLDELFGVTNNKQAVRGINYLDLKEFKEEHPEDYKDILEHNLKTKLREQLSRVFKQNHVKISDVIKSRRPRAKKVEDKIQDVSTKIANEALKGNLVETKSSLEGQNKSDADRTQEWIDRIKSSDSTIDDETAAEIAKIKINSFIEKDFDSWPGTQFFTVEPTGNTSVLVINKKHPFYQDMYEKLESLEDPHAIETLDLMLMAYARMQDELYSRMDDLDEISDKWGSHLKKFLLKLRENN